MNDQSDTSGARGVQPGDAEPVPVWIVEDNHHLRATLTELVDRHPATRCALSVPDYEQVFEAIEAEGPPPILLSDLELPKIDGVAGIRRMREVAPDTRIVVLTVHEDDQKVFDALCAGAIGYLLKPASGEKIIDAIHDALGGGSPMNAYIASKVLRAFTEFRAPPPDYRLTRREREVLQLLVEDHTQTEVATMLHLSPHTVDSHLRNIYAKLQVHSRSAAVAKALRERLI